MFYFTLLWTITKTFRNCQKLSFLMWRFFLLVCSNIGLDYLLFYYILLCTGHKGWISFLILNYLMFKHFLMHPKLQILIHLDDKINQRSIYLCSNMFEKVHWMTFFKKKIYLKSILYMKLTFHRSYYNFLNCRP